METPEARAATPIIRGMAVGEIEARDMFKVLWKELRVGALVGIVLGAANYLRLILMYPGNEMLCMTVVLSLFVTVVLAKTVGCVLPILAKMCKMDPAIMADPWITTIVDGFSLAIYFQIACHLLNLTV